MCDPYNCTSCHAARAWQKVLLWDHALGPVALYYQYRGSLILGPPASARNRLPWPGAHLAEGSSKRGGHMQLGPRVLHTKGLSFPAAHVNPEVSLDLRALGFIAAMILRVQGLQVPPNLGDRGCCDPLGLSALCWAWCTLVTGRSVS